MNAFFKFLVMGGLLLGNISLNAAVVIPRQGLTIFKGRLQCVGAESDKFLWYTPDSRDPRGFRLTVNRYIENSSTFTIEYTKLRCETGETIQQELFGNSGEYYVGNIITPDKKYLMYDVDKSSLCTVTKIPTPDYSKYAWLIFHCKQLNQYFFWPLFQQPMFLQKFRFPDVIDVILFQKSGTDGENYTYWKFIPEAQAVAK
jgi:hypothetical protein